MQVHASSCSVCIDVLKYIAVVMCTVTEVFVEPNLVMAFSMYIFCVYFY